MCMHVMKHILSLDIVESEVTMLVDPSFRLAAHWSGRCVSPSLAAVCPLVWRLCVP